MNFQINEQAAAALSKRKKHNIYLFALSIAAVFTVIGVIIVLTRPGHAFSSLEKTLECQVEVHQHTADCYDAEGNLICGYADYVAHVHDPELCYDENGDLVCQLPEIIPHEHDDSCYLERMVLICGCEEGQVVDSQGNPVFDAEGKPVFDIADVPDVESISVEGDLTEDAAAEDVETIEGEEITEGEATEGEAVDAEAAETEASDTEATDTDAVNAEVTDKDAANTEASGADVNGTEETESNGTESAEAANGTDNTEKTDADVTVEDNKEKTDADVTAENNKENTDNTEEAVNTEETVNTENTEEAVSTEETAPANAAETPANDEIITETVDLGQNAGTVEEEYSIHHHTAECYKIEKELICTIPTLHVHDSSCYDNEGNLICGQLQLTMHVHGEDCFHFEEKTVTQTAVAGDYTITATYGASAKIPSKAELVVDIIDNGEGTSQEAQEALSAYNDENAEVVAGFDIRFMFNGEEIQPEGPVNITISSNNAEENDQVIEVIHLLDNGQTEVFNDTVNENGDISFDATSFSPYLMVAIKAIPEAKEYDNTILDYNSVRDGYEDSRFDKYKITDGIFGSVASNFHIIAFEEATLNSHVNGNILVNKLISAQDFGTNAKTINGKVVNVDEISYIVSLGSFTGRLDQETDGDDHVVVLGSDTKVTISGNKVEINGKSLDNNTSKYTIIDTDSENTPFIDLALLKTNLVALSGNFYTTGVNNPNINVYADLTTDMNNRYILLTDPDLAGYYNMTAKELNDISGQPLKLLGFQTGSDGKSVRNGSIIINVDCSGADKVTMPTEAKVYSGTQFYDTTDGSGNKKYVVTNNGTAANIEETVDFSAGKVIWNFYNCNNTEITGTQLTGCILAPNAVLKISNSNGNFIADKITVNGETHRTDFRGTTVPFSASFEAYKKVNGQTPVIDKDDPSKNESFKFLLQEYNKSTGEWETIDSAWNEGSNIAFSKTVKKYDKESDKGYHYFRIKEDTSTPCKNGKTYGFDKTVYYIVINVKREGNTYTAETKYYKGTEDGGYTGTGNGELLFSEGINDQKSMVFNNTPELTEISVEKVWLDTYGKTLNNPPESLEVYLFRTTDATISTSTLDVTQWTKDKEAGAIKCLDVVDLAKTEIKWQYKWTDLPEKDAQGREYFYFVKEKEIAGFKADTNCRSWQKKYSYILTNREEGTTFIEINKDFVAYGFGGGENNLLVLDSPFINGIVNPDAYVTFRLTRKPTVDGVVGEEEPYTGTVLVNGEEVTGGVFKVKAGTNNDWKAIVEQLPAVSYENNTVTTYEYFVTETEEKSEEVKPYKFLDMKVSLAGEGKDAHKVFTVRNLLGNTEFEIDKTWLTYTGSVMTTLQDNPSAEVVVPITIVQYNEDKTSFNDYGSYLLGAQSITDINGNTTNKAELIEDNASSTGKKLWAAKFTDLPAYYAEKQTDGKVILKKYSYSAAEGVISGYALITEPIKDDNGNVIAEASKLDAELTDFTYTNIVLVNQSNTTFSLPETGGAGRSIIPVYIAGAVVILSLIALLAYRKKLRRN